MKSAKERPVKMTHSPEAKAFSHVSVCMCVICRVARLWHDQ